MLNELKFATKQVQVLASRCYSMLAVPKPDPRAQHRLPPPCGPPPYEGPVTKPCIDIDNIQVERARAHYAPLIRSFLYTYYYTREPSLVGLFIPLNSKYLDYLTNHFIRESNGFLAFDTNLRSGEKELVGLMFANKKFPWEAEVFEKWGDKSDDPERIHMYFHAHCFSSPKIFKKHKVPFVYDIEMIGTATEYVGHGVAEMLLRSAILYAIEMRYPVVQMIATNSYMNEPCRRLGMKKEWTMDFLDYVDVNGRSVFCPRQPHKEVNIFVRTLQPYDRGCPDPLYTPELYQLFRKQIGRQVCTTKPLELLQPLPICPTLRQPMPRKEC